MRLLHFKTLITLTYTHIIRLTKLLFCDIINVSKREEKTRLMNRLFAYKRQFIILLVLLILFSLSAFAQESENKYPEAPKTYVASTLFSSMHNSEVMYRYFLSNPDSKMLTPGTLEKISGQITNLTVNSNADYIYLYISPLDFYESDVLISKQNEIFNLIGNKLNLNTGRVSSLTEYATTNGGYFNAEHFIKPLQFTNLSYINQVAQDCTNSGVTLKVILVPCFSGNNSIVSHNDIKTLKGQLSQICSFYDYTGTDLTDDPRFFYNKYELRSTLVNEIAYNTIFPDDISLYEDFGQFIEKGTYIPENDIIKNVNVSDYTVNVPVLLYHHIGHTNFSNDIISVAGFKSQLDAINNAGFNTVSLNQLHNYVYYGIPLPEKPVCITFDDGYESNYNIAYPYMKKLGMNGTIFVIGSSVGKDTYKETSVPIYPHFNLLQADEMIKSGVMQIHSHSFDMHQSPQLEEGVARQSADILPGESVEDYMIALENDYTAFRDNVYNALGVTDRFIAYPHGIYTEITEQFFSKKGVSITMSTRSDTVNTIIKGVPQSLRAMRRITINDNYTADILVNILNSYYDAK